MLDFSKFRRTLRRRPTRPLILETLAALAANPQGLPLTSKELSVIVFKPTDQEQSRQRSPCSQSQFNLLAQLEQQGAVQRLHSQGQQKWQLTTGGLKYIISQRPELGYLLRPIDYLNGQG